jgi:hypothetical protein
MVKAAEEMVEKMKRGELTGWIFIAASATGDDVTGVYGDFADRLQYAVYATSQHHADLVRKAAESPGLGYSSTGPMSGTIPPITVDQELPRMLRLGGRR